MEEFVFWSLTMQFHCSKKSLFLPFLDTKPFFAMKITNHHDKQLTPSESWDQDGFFEPGFGVSSHSNHWAKNFTMLWPTNQGEHLERLIYILPHYRCVYIVTVYINTSKRISKQPQIVRPWILTFCLPCS